MNGNYRSRIATADAALAEVQSGQSVYIHNGCAEPPELVEALTRRGPELRDVRIIHMATIGRPITSGRNSKAISATMPCSSAATCARRCRKAAPITRPSS